MNVRHALGAVAIAGMVTSPALAQTDRASAPAAGEAEMGGSGTLLAILAVALIIAAVIIAADGGDEVAVSA